MNCPSNPRELAYKRNYRCLLLALVIFLPTNAAFASQKSLKPLPTTTPHGLRLTPVQVPNDRNNNNNHNNNKDVQLSTSAIEDVVLTRSDTGFDKLTDFVAARAPGVALSVAIAQLSIAVGKTALGTHVSPLLWATLFGMCYGNMLYRPEAKQSLAQGIKFSKGRLLRLGIILYGFKITLQQIAGIGMAGVMTDLVMVTSTLTLGITLGTKYLGLDRALSTLIGSGAAICGCSAVLATQPVVGGESHQVSAAVGTVVMGGTISMFLYPLLFKLVPFLANSPKLMGIYTGSTIHEIAGVVAAGNAMGGDVAFTAVVTKLARVLLLAPVLTTLSWIENKKCLEDSDRNKNDCKLIVPWFAFGFVAVSALNSMFSFPTALVKMASKTSAFTLVCAMAALGIDSDFNEIRKLGSKPLILAVSLWGWLAVGGLGIAKFFMGA